MTGVHDGMKFSYILSKETEKAFLLKVPIDGNETTFPEQYMERWFPKSQVELFPGEAGEVGYVSIPRWLAEKAGLV